MKKERKELLMHSFPAATADQMSKMEGKGAANYIIFLTRGAELFARGYHRYSNGYIVERQRYVFAKDGAVRYGSEDGSGGTFAQSFVSRSSAQLHTGIASTTRIKSSTKRR